MLRTMYHELKNKKEKEKNSKKSGFVIDPIFPAYLDSECSTMPSRVITMAHSSWAHQNHKKINVPGVWFEA